MGMSKTISYIVETKEAVSRSRDFESVGFFLVHQRHQLFCVTATSFNLPPSQRWTVEPLGVGAKRRGGTTRP